MYIGDRVLEWGSGCGHKASWMRIHFGVDVVGVEGSRASVNWANAHSLGTFCAAAAATSDGAKQLEFLPDASFQHALSVAAVFQLPYEAQCGVLKELLRLVVDGGTISLMWCVVI